MFIALAAAAVAAAAVLAALIELIPEDEEPPISEPTAFGICSANTAKMAVTTVNNIHASIVDTSFCKGKNSFVYVIKTLIIIIRVIS